MAKTSDVEIIRLETRGEIARGWKAIAGGLALVNKVIDDLLDPQQADLFPWTRPSSRMTSLRYSRRQRAG